MESGDPSALRVGSWPGQSYHHNAFIGIFCDALADAGAEVIDVRNPFRLDTPIDVLQIHWAEEIFWRGYGRMKSVAAVFRTLAAIAAMRRRGVRVYWMVHNLRPHDAQGMKKRIWRYYSRVLARTVDGYVALSPATLPVIARSFSFRPAARPIAVRHPSYPTPTTLPDRDEARARLGLPDARALFAFVGAVRRYKGVGPLVDAVKACDPQAVALVAAGQANEAGLIAELQAKAAGTANIRLVLERLTDEAFVDYVRAADYVVLPFVDSLHSGSLVHALSLGRAVLTLATPYACDLAEIVGKGWVTTYEGPLTAELLAKLPPPPAGAPDLSALDPRLMGRTLVDYYRAGETN